MGKFHKSIVAVAVVCVMFGPMVHAHARDFWASMGKFHKSIAVVAVVWAMFGPMVHVHVTFGRAWVNSMNLLQWLPLFVSYLGQWCMHVTLGERR